MKVELIKNFEEAQIAKISEVRKTPDFRPGDSLNVGVKIIEGKNERLQYFQGLCIARKNDSINSNFTVRKISNNEGVERTFPLYSPKIASIEVVRKGVVRRSKLYYMRELRGKAARIKEKQEFFTKKTAKKTPEKDVKKAEVKETPKKEVVSKKTAPTKATPVAKKD